MIREVIRAYIASEGPDGFRAELRAGVFLGAVCAVLAACVAAVSGVN